LASVVAAVMFAGVGLVGCGGAEFEDRTAEVSLGETSISFDLVSCGLDGSTVFLVGRGGGASILQVVMELDDDASTGLVEATGVSVDRAGEFHEAFGEQSWRARGETGDPPGVIESAQLRGSRVQIEGRAASSKGGTPLDLSVDARCDLKD